MGDAESREIGRMMKTMRGEGSEGRRRRGREESRRVRSHLEFDPNLDSDVEE